MFVPTVQLLDITCSYNPEEPRLLQKEEPRLDSLQNSTFFPLRPCPVIGPSTTATLSQMRCLWQPAHSKAMHKQSLGWRCNLLLMHAYAWTMKSRPNFLLKILACSSLQTGNPERRGYKMQSLTEQLQTLPASGLARLLLADLHRSCLIMCSLKMTQNIRRHPQQEDQDWIDYNKIYKCLKMIQNARSFPLRSCPIIGPSAAATLSQMQRLWRIARLCINSHWTGVATCAYFCMDNEIPSKFSSEDFGMSITTNRQCREERLQNAKPNRATPTLLANGLARLLLADLQRSCVIMCRLEMSQII